MRLYAANIFGLLSAPSTRTSISFFRLESAFFNTAIVSKKHQPKCVFFIPRNPQLVTVHTSYFQQQLAAAEAPQQPRHCLQQHRLQSAFAPYPDHTFNDKRRQKQIHRRAHLNHSVGYGCRVDENALRRTLQPARYKEAQTSHALVKSGFNCNALAQCCINRRVDATKRLLQEHNSASSSQHHLLHEPATASRRHLNCRHCRKNERPEVQNC